MDRTFDVGCPAHGTVATGLAYQDAIAFRREHWTTRHPVAAMHRKYGGEVMPMPSRLSHIQIERTGSGE